MVYINILNLYVAHCCVFLFILFYIVVYILCAYSAGYKYLNTVEHELTLLQKYANHKT